MKFENILGLIGIVLGVPGFLLLFFKGNFVFGILVVVLVAILVWVVFEVNRTEFTILEVEKRLTFHDSIAHRATLVSSQRVRSNHRGLSEFWCRNISADGPIENVLIDGREPDETSMEAGDMQICKRFPHPLAWRQRIQMVVSYDLINSFPGNPEGLIHTVDRQTKKLRLVVDLNSCKPCAVARAFLRFGGQVYKSLDDPEVSEGRSVISVEVSNPRQGGEYYIEWEW